MTGYPECYPCPGCGACFACGSDGCDPGCPELAALLEGTEDGDNGGLTEQGSRRLLFLEPGPVAVCEAEYTLDSGEMARYRSPCRWDRLPLLAGSR